MKSEEKGMIIYINWAALLAFATFWSYGFFGALTGKNIGLIENILISIIVCGIFVLFMWLWEKSDVYRDSIVITKKDVLIWISFFILMTILSYKSLIMPLNGDQLAHAQQSKLHSITIINWISLKLSIVNDINIKKVIYGIDILIITAAFLLYRFIRNKKWILKVGILAIVFLTFRFTIMAFGGSDGAHPTLRLFPMWMVSAIIGSFDFSFRIAQLIGLVSCMWLIQRGISHKIGYVNAYCVAWAIGTIPVLWHVGILAESSIWTAIIWILLLLSIFIKEDISGEGGIEYIRWVSIISLFAMMRQPVFFALIPLMVICIQDAIKKREYSGKRIVLIIAPILLVLPFLLNNIISGNPADFTGYAYENPYIPADASSIQRVWIAWSSGVIPNIITNAVGKIWIWFLFIPLIFIYKYPTRVVTTIVFFFIGIYVFYIIDPGLWGIGRYQAEYIVPFIALGFVVGIKFLSENKGTEKLASLVCIILIVWNVHIFENLPKFQRPINELKMVLSQDIKKRDNPYAVLSEFPYEYGQAFREARRVGYAGKTFVAGVTYGVFGEILSGFTVLEIEKERDIYNAMQSDISAKKITNNKEIQLVLISFFPNEEKLKNDLENQGWKQWKEFRNNKYGSTIFGLVRKNAI